MKNVSSYFLLGLVLVACTTSQQPSEQATVSVAPSAPTLLQPMDCKSVSLPTPNPVEEVTCVQTDTSFCAFFPNGKPFYCATKDGKRVHRLNKWGSSLTVSHFDEKGQQLDELYYAYGKMTRGADYDNQARVLTRFWWDEDGQIRVYRYDFNGRVLDKYYFRKGQQYVRYPNGNDMGEMNGPWQLQGQTIFTDNRAFYVLPDNLQPAPDTCALFTPLCEKKI